MSINLSKNSTVEDRSASITIVCGESEVVISIEQKAADESVEKPEPEDAMVKQITQNETEFGMGSDNESGVNSIYKFTYGENKLPSLMSLSYLKDPDEGYTANIKFSYSDKFLSYYDYDLEERVDINDKGQIESDSKTYQYGVDDGDGQGEFTIDGTRTFTNTYNEDGYLVKVVYVINEVSHTTGAYSSIDTYTLTWENGNCVKIEHSSNSYPEVINIEYSEYENSTNVDVFIMTDISPYPYTEPVFSALGYNGKFCKNLPIKVKTYSDGVYKSLCTYEYEFNEGGLPSNIVSKSTVFKGGIDNKDAVCVNTIDLLYY